MLTNLPYIFYISPVEASRALLKVKFNIYYKFNF